MHTVLENLPIWEPEYAGQITQQAFEQLRDGTIKSIGKAVEVINAYFTSGNEALLSIAIGKLHDAERDMNVMVPVLSDEAADRLSKLATFIFDIGGVLLGGTKHKTSLPAVEATQVAGKEMAKLEGKLAYEPELRFTVSGIAVCNFKLKVGDKLEKVTAWRGLAEACTQHLEVGDKLLVYGKEFSRPYTTQEGEKKEYSGITARKVYRVNEDFSTEEIR